LQGCGLSIFFIFVGSITDQPIALTGTAKITRLPRPNVIKNFTSVINEFSY
jgi:hypothetical protein